MLENSRTNPKPNRNNHPILIVSNDVPRNSRKLAFKMLENSITKPKPNPNDHPILIVCNKVPRNFKK